MDLFSEELDDPALEPTYTVSQLGGELRDLLREAYASVWVAGELQRLVERRNGHRYFELIENPGEASLAVITPPWRTIRSPRPVRRSP